MLTDRYRVVKKLGEGASGRTYLVRDRKLGKYWAVKEWREGGTGRSEKEFWEELKALKDMNHTFFPRIVETFREGEHRYLVMDWINGKTLEELLREKGKLDWKQAVEYTVSLCEALALLHAKTPPLLHLDLKPSNIMVTQDGIKLIDFGSSMWQGGEGVGSGTPGYASPEQMGRAESIQVDTRSDIYSLGAVCYVMLTGRKWEAEKPVWNGIPFRLRQTLQRALREKREERFASVGEMKRAILRAGEERRRMRRMAGGVFGAAVCLIVLRGTFPGLTESGRNTPETSISANDSDTDQSFRMGKPKARRAVIVYRYRKGWRKKPRRAAGTEAVMTAAETEADIRAGRTGKAGRTRSSVAKRNGAGYNGDRL